MGKNEELQKLRELVYADLDAGHYEQAIEKINQLPLQGAAEQEVQGLLASACIEAKKLPEAEAAVHRLLALAPGDDYARFLQLRIRFQAGERELTEELAALLHKGNALPENVREKVYNLLGQCWRFLGNSEKSAAAYKKAAACAPSLDLKLLEYSNYLFNLHYCEGRSTAWLLAEHRKYQQMVAAVPQFLHRRRQENKKIRIGYISPDIRNHVVLRFSYALFAGYDASSFEVWAYSRSLEDGWSRKVMELTDGWRNLTGLPPAEAARVIYEDGIDILVDLSGHTQGSCLPILAYRPAPVQLSGIGYFATTGMAAVDYFLTDAFLMGQENTEGRKIAGAAVLAGEICRQQGFVEKLLVLEHSHFCYTPLYREPLPKAVPSVVKGYITFGSFNNFTKVTDSMLGLWREILQRVPASHLLLKAAAFDLPVGRQQAEARLRSQQIDISRVELRGFSRQYLAEYNDVDIALDTYPYPGGGTTLDALYMGVPVVTLCGTSHGSRFGGSILYNAGLSECCTVTAEGYIETAVRLAGDPELLNLLRKNLRQMLQHSPLMDAKAYLKDMEAGYRRIWSDYCSGQGKPSLQDISRQLPVMKQLAAAEDWRQAAAVADFVWAARPADRYAMELLAGVYIDAGDEEKALELCQALHQQHGDYGYGVFLMARACWLAGEWERTEAFGRQALELGGLKAWQLGMVHDILGRICKETGRPQEAAEAYRQASCELENEDSRLSAYDNYLLCLHYSAASGQEICQAARGWEQLLPAHGRYEHQRESRHAKLRIGYISPDLRSHVAMCFIKGLFQHYDHHRFTVYAYANCQEDEVSRELSLMVSQWQNIRGWSPECVARQIRQDEIDILVDLAGHTEGSGLPVLAWRPAPVQVSGIGYMSTTGTGFVDYFWGDRYLDSAGEQQNFTEILLSEAHSHFYYVPYQAPLFCLAAPCGRNGYVTFGSFNHFAKVTDEVLGWWKEILEQLPTAQLFLKTGSFDHAYGRQWARQRLAAQGVPLERVRMEGRSADYMEAYGKVDILLDTCPYPGGGTTCDALYMGVPVITMAGQRHGARFGVSLLENIGLPEYIAATPAEYIAKAVALARKPERIRQLHQTLRRRMQESPVMEAGSYMTDLETAYEYIWQQWLGDRQGQIPAVVQAGFGAMQQALREEKWDRAVRAGGHLTGMGVCQAKLYSSLAFAYRELKDAGRSSVWARRALAEGFAGPGTADLYFLLGWGCYESCRYVQALQAYEGCQAYIHEHGEQAGDSPGIDAASTTLLAHCRFLLGNPEDIASYKAAFIKAADRTTRCNMYSSRLLCLHTREAAPEKMLAEHLGYQQIFSDVTPYDHKRHQRHERLRIGYISSDFRWHVMYFFYFQLLAGHDRDAFEVYCYCLNDKQDEFTRAVQSQADVWRDVAEKPYEEIAQLIFQDEIDILYDLAGHSAYSGLPVLAWKPAPVQLSGLGYMDTTGLPTVDYFLADSWCAPAAVEPCFTEKLLRLTSLFCYTGRLDVAEPKGAPCREKGYMVFGVFNHYRKFTDEMLSAWRKILERVPQSRLLLKNQLFLDPEAVDIAYGRLQALGFDMDRVWFEAGSIAYMDRYLDVDIALDTYPYPGGGTTCDALYMGVPVISRYGERYGSRFGLSILQSAGLGELAVDSVPAYIERAVSLAADQELLELLHRQLRSMLKASRLMDGEAYVREMEMQYKKIWQQYQRVR